RFYFRLQKYILTVLIKTIFIEKYNKQSNEEFTHYSSSELFNYHLSLKLFYYITFYNFNDDEELKHLWLLETDLYEIHEDIVFNGIEKKFLLSYYQNIKRKLVIERNRNFKSIKFILYDDNE